MDKSGVIYILTNPSFPEYVKSGMRTISTSGCSSSIGVSAFPLHSGFMRPMRSIPGFLI